jgi:hypothetical protein
MHVSMLRKKEDSINKERGPELPGPRLYDLMCLRDLT